MQCCSVACPLSSHVAMVGTMTGYLCAISLTNLASPQLVTKRRVYYSPVKAIRLVVMNTINSSICTKVC